ncbi:MAG: hypothetical protein KGI37_10775, partial [Alphaproteobacteria bacterium]|nr:hypothetical protein [Alphaproteobacteria bacterium]
LQKQLGDQWYQVTAQIEATRTDIIATVARQLAALETRLPAGNGDGLAKTASDYAAQRQVEQQTQILSELVATLGVLDAHMQQIKSEIHGRAI